MSKTDYKIRNGLLEKNGKPIFALGTSYYPSYHAKKVSVPEDGDRMGEMIKDIRHMVDAGLHLVRCASLGRVWYDENREVKTDTPFIDAMLRRAEECGLGVMVRLQGYSMNLSGWEDARMLDSHGRPMDGKNWWDFIQNSFYHEGILHDNDLGTEALAKHFATFPSVAGWQTYNEPHYPSDEMFDYHPATVAAFREWLTAYMPKETAMSAEPPRERPAGKEDDTTLWTLWRLFSMQSLSNFLNHCSDVAKDATGYESMTCLTTDVTNNQNAARGVNFFDSAERMDAIGITQYYMISKPEAYLANMNLDLAECAGSVYSKPMWIVEYDARTDIPPECFRRLTYMAVGCGCKGIMYYQWRGDYIFPDSPEGNGFGLLNYDGTKTANYNNAVNVMALINRLSDELVNAKKLRSGVGILHSDYAYMQADGRDNSGIASDYYNLKNSWLSATVRMYTELRREGVTPDFLRARDLAANPLGVKLLLIPSYDLLSEEEKQAVEAFRLSGGEVVLCNDTVRYQVGYLPFGYVERKYKSDYDMEDILALYQVEKPFLLHAPSHYLHQTLVGDGYYVVTLTNISNLEHAPADLVLETALPLSSATVYSFDRPEGRNLPITNGRILLDRVADGAFVILKL